MKQGDYYKYGEQTVRIDRVLDIPAKDNNLLCSYIWNGSKKQIYLGPQHLGRKLYWRTWASQAKRLLKY